MGGAWMPAVPNLGIAGSVARLQPSLRVRLADAVRMASARAINATGLAALDGDFRPLRRLMISSTEYHRWQMFYRTIAVISASDSPNAARVPRGSTDPGGWGLSVVMPGKRGAGAGCVTPPTSMKAWRARLCG